MAAGPTETAGAARAWVGWTRLFVAAGLACAFAAWAFVAVLDPFGMRVAAGGVPRPLMDINQRFMYPQLVRSGRFDAAVLGTSTMRLLDPAALSRDLSARFVNLAMNAATPWEQSEMAGLFARSVAAPAMVIWGVDATWCEADATAPERRLTPRPFPAWLYDGVGWADWAKLVNLTALEIAGRLLGNRLGLMRERIRGDGYEVFTPPEATYDLARARWHLYGRNGGAAPETAPLVPPVPVGDAERAAWRFPALAWLEQRLGAFPPATRRLIVLPPTHLASQPREGSAEWQRREACKAAIVALARRQGALVVDYAHASPITGVDANYWDPLHFRLAVAGRIESELAAIMRGAAPSGDGAARILTPAR